MSPPRGIFISYRRSTSAGYAGRIRDHLTERYGENNVFMDVDSIELGTDFVDAIDASLGASRAILVVIDPGWAMVADEDGHPRLTNPADWVRTEIERALARASDGGLALIPVLVGGADFPAQEQLPDSIRALTRYNGTELRDTHFEADLDDVMDRLGRGWRRWAQLSVAVTAFLALVVVLGWLTFRNTTPEVPTVDDSLMVGDLNIAVAEFTTLDESGGVVVDPDFTLDVDIARELAGQMESLGDSQFSYDIRAPEATGMIRGRDEQERAASAAALATQIDADIVIYGFRERSSPQEITPEFYVSTRGLGDALELAGPYPMGARISDSSRLDTASRRALRLEMLRRTRSMADFVAGVVSLKLDQADEARTWFESAVEGVSQWENPTNSEVFHLYVGSANLRLGDIDAAEAAYQDALGLQPGYARAMIGLAEVEFQRSRGQCFAGTTDDAALEDALRLYDEAAEQSAPPQAQIEFKAALGRGRVMACRSQAGDALEWDTASEELSSVIDAYTGGQTSLEELAALAYGARATTSLRLNEFVPTASQLRAAADDLEAGYIISGQSKTRQIYAGLLGFVYDILGDRAATDLWCARSTSPDRCPAALPISPITLVAVPAYGFPEDHDVEEVETDSSIDAPTPAEEEPPVSVAVATDEGGTSAGDAEDSGGGAEVEPTDDVFPDVFDGALPASR